MPVQQITVVPAREAAGNGKSAPRSRDKNEGKKAPGRSGSRSSNISKASNAASRASTTPSAQDICSSAQVTRLDDISESHKPSKRKQNPSAMTVASTALSSAAQAKKKQVKRRHRRKRSSCSTLDCLDQVAKPEQSERSLSPDRSELGEKRERTFRNRKELPPRLRCSGAPGSDSSSGDEAWRETRSWSKEKARRARRRSVSSREREAANDGRRGGQDKVEAMELQSVDSDEGKENQPLAEDGLKKRRGNGGSAKSHSSQTERSRSREKDSKGYKSRSSKGSSSLPEDGEELITKRYQERGSGDGDMSVPVPQNHCEANGGTAGPCSDDSELEVCRICHCEGDDDCPLITPCCCTGSLSFVHQTCLNQWIKSSDTRCCELCKFDFIMETKLKPLSKWEKLHMSKSEKRKIFCSVLFHLVAIVCMLWSVYILVRRTADEIRLGKNEELRRFSLLKYYSAQGVLEWPFWTKLIVVAIGFTGGLIFMYIQSRVYLQLWRRLKAFNRIITVQNCPEKNLHNPQARHGALSNGRHEAVEVPLAPAPDVDSDMSVEAAVAPDQNPV